MSALALTWLALGMFVFVGSVFLAENVSESRARNAILQALGDAPRVRLNGVPIESPAPLLAALRGLRHVPAHHSSPGAAVRVEMVVRGRADSVNLARDSERPAEFWVFRAGGNWHGEPLGQDAGRVTSAELDRFLRSRGL